MKFSFSEKARLRTTSQSASQTAPLVGEPLAKPFTLRGLPKPPLGRSNGDDRRQWRKQGGAVGAAASRMRAAAKQTLGAATRAVSPKVTERASPAGKSRCAAMGRLFVRAILSQCQSCLAAALPSQSRRPAPRQLPQRGSLCLRALREFVENARLKRKEFVNVIKMRRRY